MCRFFKDSQDSAEAAKRAEIVKIVEDYDDIQAENVLELVRSSKGNYIVFIDSDLEIDWETTDHYDGEHKDDTFTKQRNHILQRLNELQYPGDQWIGGGNRHFVERWWKQHRKLNKKKPQEHPARSFRS